MISKFLSISMMKYRYALTFLFSSFFLNICIAGNLYEREFLHNYASILNEYNKFQNLKEHFYLLSINQNISWQDRGLAREASDKARSDYFNITMEPFIGKYGWGIPNDQAIRTILKYSKEEGFGIIEIGAGRGFWAHLISDNGGDIVAFDDFSWEKGTKPNNLWFPVRPRDHTEVKNYSDRVLFLCWPPRAENMAGEALRLYSGNTVIYVGEEQGGQTADQRFFKLLKLRKYEKKETVDIPNWPFFTDKLYVYRKSNLKYKVR